MVEQRSSAPRESIRARQGETRGDRGAPSRRGGSFVVAHFRPRAQGPKSGEEREREREREDSLGTHSEVSVRIFGSCDKGGGWPGPAFPSVFASFYFLSLSLSLSLPLFHFIEPAPLSGMAARSDNGDADRSPEKKRERERERKESSHT